ncbi:MAG: hypothetical protein JXA98_00920 [Methanosarcinaceae archaeon]|nr:hypothetical protein [Methanosarcinaceae archaeon]
MSKEQTGAIGLLFIFMVIIAAVLAYSLPSNVYSPQKGSATEVSLMEYSNDAGDTGSVFVRSHIFINSPDLTDVTLGGITSGDLIQTEPDAAVSSEGVVWNDVFSRRSRTYFEGGEYDSLYYEASVPFEPPLDVSLGFNGSRVTAVITNNADVPVEDVFVDYLDGVQNTRYTGHLSAINARSITVLDLKDQYLDQIHFANVMKDNGISDYAVNALFYDDTYGMGVSVFGPRDYSRTWSQVVYRLPEGLHDDLIPLTVTPSPTKLHRFAWVVAETGRSSGSYAQSTGTTYVITLDPAHHHLGDDTYPDLVPEEAEGVSYSRSFDVDRAADSAEVLLTMKNVVPANESTGEFYDQVYLNGKNIGKLNDYVLNETQDYVPVTVSIPFDPSLLRGPDNRIEITSGSNTNGTNYDDFEFYDLKIVIHSNIQLPIAIPEEVEVEVGF